jgi:hypothetical protein
LDIHSITLVLSHPDFTTIFPVVPVGPKNAEPFEIRVSPGISLTLNAVDVDSKSIVGPFGVLVSGINPPMRWRSNSAGELKCQAMTPGNRQLMLVQQLDNASRLFSDAITYRFAPSAEESGTLDDIELSPGIAIRGKLSEQVPRPIKNGVVIAVHMPLPAGPNWDENLPSVEFHDSCKINEDGSFGWDSMPRTGKIQLIAMCDGWAGLNSQNGASVYGQVFEVDETSLDVELEMQPTFDAKFRIVDENEQPLTGINCNLSPNQTWLLGGSTMVGTTYRSLEVAMSASSDSPKLIATDVSLFNHYV